jgi:hypothetical protein
MCISRVELPDSNYTLVPKVERKEGMHYVVVDQNLDQSIEEPKVNLLTKASTRA